MMKAGSFSPMTPTIQPLTSKPREEAPKKSWKRRFSLTVRPIENSPVISPRWVKVSIKM